jgi:hypothetical protein
MFLAALLFFYQKTTDKKHNFSCHFKRYGIEMQIAVCNLYILRSAFRCVVQGGENVDFGG